MANNELQLELQVTLGEVMRELNAAGVNLQARHDVLMKTYAYTGGDKHKRSKGVETEAASQALTVITLAVRDQRRWDTTFTVNESIGDVRLEVAADDVSAESLKGEDLAEGQTRYYLIGGTRYTYVNGSYEDLVLKHRLVLKKVKP